MKRAARKAADIVARVEERIGHRFADAGRLERALTHSSLRNPSGGNYERLEFLGDRVLGLCVAELLFEHFREASRRRIVGAAQSARQRADLRRGGRRARLA
jgi:ribonuclease-3